MIHSSRVGLATNGTSGDGIMTISKAVYVFHLNKVPRTCIQTWILR